MNLIISQTYLMSVEFYALGSFGYSQNFISWMFSKEKAMFDFYIQSEFLIETVENFEVLITFFCNNFNEHS